MKKKFYSSICIWCLVVIALCACEKQELADMVREANEDYAAILWEDKTYVPFCAFSRADCGEQIGIVDGDREDKVYEYKGYSRDEWIISMYGRNLDTVMLYREINVSDIPDGLQSEYEWNRKTAVTFQAIVMEQNNDTILVKPLDGFPELNSADEFSITNEEDLELQVGDIIEIAYNGDIIESYPAQLGEVYDITVIEQAEADTVQGTIKD